MNVTSLSFEKLISKIKRKKKIRSENMYVCMYVYVEENFYSFYKRINSQELYQNVLSLQNDIIKFIPE